MKRKTIILVIIGLLVVAYMLPLLWEILNFRLGFFTICIGTGCSGSGGSQPGSPTPGTTWCDGYELGFLCLANKKEYCFYSSSLSMDKCLCEAVSNYEGRNVYRKFCSRNNICYSNSFEYDFGCSEDLERICKEREREISDATPEDCTYAWGHNIVKDMSECSQKYIYIYRTVDEAHKNIIFNEGYIERKKESIRIKDVCNSLCANCNSTLCDKDHLCEYAKFPLQDQNS